MPKIEKSPDAKIKVSLENGPEVFTADDPMAMTEQLAKSIDEGRKYFGGEIARRDAELEQLRQQLQQQQQPPSQPVNQQEEETRKWVAAQAAQGLLGASPEEVRNKWQQFEQFREQTETNWAVTQFYQSHPEYPSNQKAHDEIGKIFDETGWPITSTNLEAAHLIALSRKAYEPIDPNSQTSNRQTPPPILHTGNPETQLNQGSDPWSVKMDELRRMAINQQLGGNK